MDIALSPQDLTAFVTMIRFVDIGKEGKVLCVLNVKKVSLEPSALVGALVARAMHVTGAEIVLKESRELGNVGVLIHRNTGFGEEQDAILVLQTTTE